MAQVDHQPKRPWYGHVVPILQFMTQYFFLSSPFNLELTCWKGKLHQHCLQLPWVTYVYHILHIHYLNDNHDRHWCYQWTIFQLPLCHWFNANADLQLDYILAEPLPLRLFFHSRGGEIHLLPRQMVSPHSKSSNQSLHWLFPHGRYNVNQRWSPGR
jgi:hypothetical protein